MAGTSNEQLESRLKKQMEENLTSLENKLDKINENYKEAVKNRDEIQRKTLYKEKQNLKVEIRNIEENLKHEIQAMKKDLENELSAVEKNLKTAIKDKNTVLRKELIAQKQNLKANICEVEKKLSDKISASEKKVLNKIDEADAHITGKNGSVIQFFPFLLLTQHLYLDEMHLLGNFLSTAIDTLDQKQDILLGAAREKCLTLFKTAIINLQFNDYESAKGQFKEILSEAGTAFVHGQDAESWVDATKMKITSTLMVETIDVSTKHVTLFQNLEETQQRKIAQLIKGKANSW